MASRWSEQVIAEGVMVEVDGVKAGTPMPTHCIIMSSRDQDETYTSPLVTLIHSSIIHDSWTRLDRLPESTPLKTFTSADKKGDPMVDLYYASGSLPVVYLDIDNFRTMAVLIEHAYTRKTADLFASLMGPTASVLCKYDELDDYNQMEMAQQIALHYHRSTIADGLAFSEDLVLNADILGVDNPTFWAVVNRANQLLTDAFEMQDLCK
jgi:hypothetical protein